MNESSDNRVSDLLNGSETAPEQKLDLLVQHVEAHAAIPTGVEWLWLQGASVPVGDEPLLLALFDQLEAPLLSRLLGGFLRTKPESAAIRGACEALLALCEKDRAKRLTLAAFLDHPVMAGPQLVQLLGSSRKLREPCFQYYPTRSRGLPGRLRAILDDLQNNPLDFRNSIEVLLDAKQLLPNDQKRIVGWRNVRKQLQQLESIVQNPPGTLARLTRIPLTKRRKQLDQIGAALAEAATWAMPDSEFTSDGDGTRRAELLGNIAVSMLSTGHWPDGFQQRVAACFSGQPWLSLSAKLKPPEPEKTDPQPPARPPDADSQGASPQVVSPQVVKPRNVKLRKKTVRAKPFAVPPGLTSTPPPPAALNTPPPPATPPPAPSTTAPAPISPVLSQSTSPSALAESDPSTSDSSQVSDQSDQSQEASPFQKISVVFFRQMQSAYNQNAAVVVIAASLLLGVFGWWYVTTSSERAVRNLLAIENVDQRVLTFLQMSPDEINTLARLNLGNDKYDKPLLELMQKLSDKQLLKVRKSDERQALVTRAMAVAFARNVAPQEQLELLLKLPENERLPALQNLRDLPVLRHLLVNGSDADRDQLMMEMTAEERNALLGELDDERLRDLLVKLSVPMIDRIPLQQLQRLKVEDIVSVVSLQKSPVERNALLAQCPAPTLNEVVGQLHKTFLTSLDSKVLGQVNDPALVKILRGFTGESLRQLLEQVDTKRRHALQDNVKAALADGEAEEIRVLLALNIPTTPPSVKSTEIPPAPKPATPQPVVVEDKALEGRSVTYIDLPPVPEKLADVKDAHELILAAPQPNVLELKFHGLDYLRYNGTTGAGPKVKATKVKPSQHQLIYDSGEKGVDYILLCTFGVEENGEVKFKWECPEYPALQRAIEMVRCSVLEIERGGAESQFISFLKPIRISSPLQEQQAAREANSIYWILPGQQKQLYFERWPLLVNGLVLHVPSDGKPYSPKAEDLRILTPRLETLQKVHNVGGTMLKPGSTVDTAAGGEFVPAIALVMLPREPNEAEKKEVEAVEERTNQLKRALIIAQNTKSVTKRVDGVLELAFLLNRRRPSKDGEILEHTTIEFRDWAISLMDAAKVEINDGSKENLKSISLPGVKERDTLFHSGITLTGDIYRVVGFSRAKTTQTKVEGGVIVKVLEIASEAP